MNERRSPELLEASPFEDDLRSELAAQPVRRSASKVTLALGAGVVLVAGVLIGVQAQKTWGAQQPSGTRAAAGANGGFPGLAGLGGNFGARRQAQNGQNGQNGQLGQPSQGGQFGQGGQAGGFGAGGNVTFGTVKLVDGKKIYVQTADGGVVVVQTTADTRIQVSKPAKVADVKVGGTVIVAGPKDAEGTVTATSVSQGGGARP